MIDFKPADFMEEFPELHEWIQNKETFGLIAPSTWRNNGNTMQIEIIQRVIPGKIKEQDQPSLDIPPEREPDRYEYHGILTTFNQVLGDQNIIFDPYNIGEFFFKMMCIRNNFDFTFKLAKELGKPTKGTISVSMVDDTMVVEHLISHIYQ